MALTKAEILEAIEARGREVVPVEVPEWGGVVHVRRLSYAELEELGLEEGGRPTQGQVLRLLASCLADERGERLFSHAEAEALARADVGAFTRLLTEVLRANGLASAELEEMVAHFAAAQRGAASSG